MIRCDKCGVAIATGWVEYLNGVPYHKACVPQRDHERARDEFDPDAAPGHIGVVARREERERRPR